MRRAGRFWGGIHPAYEKVRTREEAIRPAETPSQVVLPVSQHIGAPAEPVVKKGDRVLAGQVVADAKGLVSVPVHSPVSGKVAEVGLRPVGSGVAQLCVVVENDGRDEWVDLEPAADPAAASPEEIKDRVRKAGIVGLGGAAFPSHVKLSPSKPIDTVLLNGAECEPYLTADDRLMREQPRRVLEGFQLVCRAVGVDRGLVCIEDNKPEAVEAMSRALADFEGMELVLLETRYPQGGEKQLIQAVLGREVPVGGLPMDVGVVVFNVGTSAAIRDAVFEGRPLVERVVTVTGSPVRRPANFLVRLGTPVGSLIEQAGGIEGEPGKVILGGPMMGQATASLDVPVVKGTSGVLVQAPEEVISGEYLACIRCGQCIRHCPMRLSANELSSRAEVGDWETMRALGVMECIECGACAWVCPSGRPLVQFCRLGKAHLRRIDRERREREARRQAAG